MISLKRIVVYLPHAKNQMLQRGVGVKEVDQTLNKGQKWIGKDGRWHFRHRHVEVVAEMKGRILFVITVMVKT